jgi:hypothetical protein
VAEEENIKRRRSGLIRKEEAKKRQRHADDTTNYQLFSKKGCSKVEYVITLIGITCLRIILAPPFGKGVFTDNNYIIII